MRVRSHAIRFVPALAGLLVAASGAFAGPAGPAEAIRPVEDVLIRPVPGYSAVCNSEWTVANRVSGGGSEVVAVEQDGDGSRLRRLSRNEKGRTVTLEAQFDDAGRVRGDTQMHIDGAIREGEHSTLTADAIRRAMVGAIYTGAPVSSGDEIKSGLTLADAQSLVNTFWDAPVRVIHWSDTASVYGEFDHATHGAVVVLFWAVEARFDGEAGPVGLSARGLSYYDPASGLDMASHGSLKFTGRIGRIVGKDWSECRYVRTPGAQAADARSIAEDPEVRRTVTY